MAGVSVPSTEAIVGTAPPRRLYLLLHALAGWLLFFGAGWRHPAFVVLLLFLSLLAFLNERKQWRLAGIANNVVAAAATYATLSDADKERVRERAAELGGPWLLEETSAFGDVPRFCWYSLAMRELQVKPVCLTTGWNTMRFPDAAISPWDRNIDSALARAEASGHRVALSRASLMEAYFAAKLQR